MKNIHIATYQNRSKKFAEDLPDFGIPVVVRLGGSMAYNDYPIQVNSAKAIRDSVDKKVQKTLLIEANINTLPLLENPQFPCVVKGRVRSCGTSVVVCNTVAEANDAIKKVTKNCNGYILEPLFKATSEYRLHCSRKEVFFAVKKIKDDPNDIIINAKNHHNVRDFVKPRKWEAIKADCVRAMEILGLDIACFDVMYSSEGEHSFAIAEANTNPEMLNNTYAAYLPVLESIIRSKVETYKKIDNFEKQGIAKEKKAVERVKGAIVAAVVEQDRKLTEQETIQSIQNIMSGNYTVVDGNLIIKL